MFEYLMPLLVMPTYDRTLLDETYRAVVDRQITYGRERGVPWGVSESGYSKTDAQLNYQYHAFGVPGLGFKRGLADDVVIAPYASAMGLMVDPASAYGEPPPARRGRPARRVRFLRGRRLHAVAAAARAGEHHGPLVHGAPPGHGVPLAGVLAARPADAAAVRVRPGVPGDRPAAAGARAQGAVGLPASGRSVGAPAARRPRPRRTSASSPRRTRRRPKSTCSPTAATTSPSPPPAAGTAAGATWPSRAGARTRRATAGARSATCATSKTGEFWSTAHQPTLKRRDHATKRSIPRAGPSSAAATTTSKRTWRSAFRPRTTSSCAGSA